MIYIVLYLCALGIGFIMGRLSKQGGYWLGRMHEYDFCKSQGWFNSWEKQG